jgi:hypothetical protein
MIHIKSVLQRVTPFGAATVLLIASAVPTLSLVRSASAAPITERGLTVTSTVPNDDLTAPDGTTYAGLSDNDPRNGQKVGHKYTFKTAAASSNIQGFTIEYCETAFGFVGAGACTADDLLDGTSGFDAHWDGGSVTINGAVFNVTRNAANYLTFVADSTGLSSVAAGTTITIDMPANTTNDTWFVNPNDDYRTADPNGTYFAHIQTFADADDAGDAFEDVDDTPAGVVDDGTVTNNVTTAIGIYTRVQETLNFSVEGDQDGVGGSADGPSAAAGTTCAPLTADGQLKMGDPNHALSSDHAYDAYSYFRLSTNSSNGVSVAYSGDTLKTSSGLDIDAATPGASAPGTEQFGLAIDASLSSLTNLAATTNYANGEGDAGLEGDAGPIVANVAFSTGSVASPVVIAQTTPPSSSVVKCDTGAVRYIANISPDTPAGIYQTKINYIASPKY